MITRKLLNRVVEHEGFRAEPYQDHLGNWTFGHGLTWITEDESRGLVSSRLHDINSQLSQKYPWLAAQSQDVREVLIEMAYQMGVTGVSKFKKCLAALKAGKYERAADEMLDSRWAEQTPGRAKELAEIVRNS